jgi:replication fork protection complex subunit Csm3/Swi3
MSVSLDDIWSEPLEQSPSRTAKLADSRILSDDDEEDNVFRPSKRQRSSLFLKGSDDEDEPTTPVVKRTNSQVRPDIDALFDDIDDPPVNTAKRSSKPFDLEAMRREAKRNAEKEIGPSSPSRYAIQSSSPPRDGLSGAFGADAPIGDKKRQIPKLDEERLLGKDGFPALIQMCKDFKPKGKGHEVRIL